MRRPLEEATVKRDRYHSRETPRCRLDDSIAARLATRNVARRPQILHGLTPYEYMCKL